MKIILHIGANKAGSTALQACLSKNRKWLLGQGILWPTTGRKAHAHYDLSTWLGFNYGQNGRLDSTDLMAERDHLRTELASSGAEMAIFSSENFMLRYDTAPVRDFFEGFDVEVVPLLRRHDSWWPSLWAQAIKHVRHPPWGRSFESFLAFQKKRTAQHLNFRELVTAWEKGFPGAVRPIPYERSQAPDGVVPSFFEAIGRPDIPAALPDMSEQSNITPKVDVLSLVDYLKRMRDIPETRCEKLVAAALNCEGKGPALSSFLSGRLLRQLAEENANTYAYLDERFAPKGEPFFRDAIPEDDGKNGPHELPSVAAFELLLNSLI